MTCASMTSLHAITSDISITSIGQRKARSVSPNNEALATTALVLKDLLQESRFFGENPARPIPSFRDPTEIIVGDELGEGEFGEVLEVVDILVPPGEPCQPCSTVYQDDDYPAPLPPSPFIPPKSITIVTSDSEEGETREDDDTVSNQHANAICACLKDDFSSDDEYEKAKEDKGCSVKKEQPKSKKPVITMASRKARVAGRVLRDGVPRYALKRLRKDATERLDAILDLACEARFLECTTHTNIIRLRATVGEPGTASFGLVLDRLTCTLSDRLLEWQQAKKKTKKNWLQQLIVKKMTQEDEMFLAERLVIALDIARALNFLHGKKILFRDLKPENLGFNVRGDLQVFDFGLAKELKAKDLVEAPDRYECTGLTGSRRYMAPEVVRCESYGFSADVFSYAILLWELFALETPFPDFSASKHFEYVVEKQKRPHKIHNILPAALHNTMDRAWSDAPASRPSMKAFCVQITDEIQQIHERLGDAVELAGDRTMHLTTRSLQSMGTHSDEE